MPLADIKTYSRIYKKYIQEVAPNIKVFVVSTFWMLDICDEDDFLIG
jgi:hypothetical protein